MRNFLIISVFLLINFFKIPQLYAQGQEEVPVDSLKVPEEHRFGFMDLNGYYDTRKGSTFTINYLAILNKKLAYFSFINYQQGAFNAEYLGDFDFFYSEHNLTYSPFNNRKIPFDINVQAVIIGGGKNDKLRLAPSWRVHDTPGLGRILKKIHLSYGINFHVVQFGFNAPLDDFTWQMEHFYKLDIAPKLTNNRLYISGFADHTMGGKIARGLVMEHQFGLRLIDNFYAVAEYRHFSYLPEKYQDGFGLGFEYLILFK
jgi:hypothetical protein